MLADPHKAGVEPSLRGADFLDLAPRDAIDKALQRLIVQALHWLRETLSEQRYAVIARLRQLLARDTSGVLRDDLRRGLPTLPAWIQDLLRETFNNT